MRIPNILTAFQSTWPKSLQQASNYRLEIPSINRTLLYQTICRTRDNPCSALQNLQQQIKRMAFWLLFYPEQFFFPRNPIPIVIHRKLSSVVHLRGISALTYPLFCAQLLIQGYSSPENGLSPSGHHKQRWGCNSSSGRGCITSLNASVTLGQFIGGRHRVERRRHRRREDSKRQNNSINYKMHHLTKKHSDLNNRKKTNNTNPKSASAATASVGAVLWKGAIYFKMQSN